MKGSYTMNGLVLLVLSVQPLAVSQQAAAQPGASYQVLHEFHGSPDGATPFANLVRDPAGNLYGTTVLGGSNDLGTVYKVDSTSQETVLHRFSSHGGDGQQPYAPLALDAAGNLYGTTTGGGRSNAGTVFKVNPAGRETVLYRFSGGADGSGPDGVILDDAGNLYGTTAVGGAFNSGTVFTLDKNGKETVLHSINGTTEGWGPPAGVVRDSAGNLYGTTQRGGKKFDCNDAGCGTVFRVDKTGKYRVLYSFSGGADGTQPITGVVRDTAGNLYGTTPFGGDLSCGAQGSGCGVVFKLDPHGKETVLHAFTGRDDGALPYGLLVLDDVGNLYGTTLNGGDLSQQCADIDHPGCGVVFRIDKKGDLTVLHTFKGGADGANPTAGVIRDAAGNLYGATQAGGDPNCAFGGGCGVVFKLTP
jgi:uncharacterized repeat protein (TIGR03803 family)